MTVIHDAAPKIHAQTATISLVAIAYHPFATPVPSNPSMLYLRHLIHLVSPMPSHFLLHARRAGP